MLLGSPNDCGVVGNGSVSYSNEEENVGGYRQGILLLQLLVTLNLKKVEISFVRSRETGSNELLSCQSEGNTSFHLTYGTFK